ncbi:ret finger protein-like 3 [Dasypus novemcinctus]|uniref:ret finger protein-like 3 n=1 Tax=Dasypus novemcinctus TaxID=9361 RepID=UPI00265DFD35|nr:ret finger protein-like 3 [Dasypus novemcinctus]
MAEQFLKLSRCPICLSYLEIPKVLKCGYICCFQCIDLLPKNRHEGIVLCPTCSKISRENEIKPDWNLGKLVSKVKEMKPQLTGILQMNPRMLKFQVDMTMDVDTADEFLIISDDLRSVHIEKNDIRKQQYRADRFSRSFCVLGSSHFTTGRHYWQVDVGPRKQWTLGVCRESANRKGRVQLSPELGFWTVSLRNDTFSSANTVPETVLWVNPESTQVGIFLDMEMGNISFYDVSDGSHIFTFTKISVSEPLRPFFAPSKSKSNKYIQGFLCIGPMKSSSTAVTP